DRPDQLRPELDLGAAPEATAGERFAASAGRESAGAQEGQRLYQVVLGQSLFDANCEPVITAKSPQGGRDIMQSSFNNFYSGVSVADLEGFTEKYPLNSRLVKDKSGKLVEEVWRAGTPDGKVPAGTYAVYLKKANEYLEKARTVAEPGQAAAIAALIRYYQT